MGSRRSVVMCYEAGKGCRVVITRITAMKRFDGLGFFLRSSPSDSG